MASKILSGDLDKIPAECIAVRASIVSRVVFDLYNSALRSHGVKITQMFILVLSSRFASVSSRELCEALHIDGSTLSRNINRMKNNGWIELESAGGRAQNVKVTEKGTKLLAKAIPAWKLAQRKAEKMFGERGIKMLNQLCLSVTPQTDRGLLRAKR